MSEGLTPRELQCLRLTAAMTDKEIARELGIAPKTVSLHVSRAMRKLGQRGRRAALRALGENPHPVSGPIGTSAESTAATPAPDADPGMADGESDNVEPPAGLSMSVPADRKMKAIWIAVFALLATILTAGGVSVVAAIIEQVTTFAPATAS
jgi:DNA-binding CsgD family transcriptional regulator